MSGTWNHQHARRPAPEPSGELVASFDRPGFRGSPDGEVRVTVDSFQGHPFLSVRLWEKGQDGVWWPTKKGLSVRIGEAEGVAAALLNGLELAGGLRGQRGREQGRGEPYRLEPRNQAPRSGPVRATVAPQRALPAPAPMVATTFSNDFDEFADPALR